MSEKQITVHRHNPSKTREKTAKKRVAVYARVSTSLESQELSLENQMVSFTNLIEASPDLVLTGVYADEGITGTSALKRTQFLQMIRDAENGMFDTIMTKSISRFARNTVICLETVRSLKEYGVNVIFQKENIDTANEMSEMLLTVLAAFAQNESYSISENLKWGIRKRFETGSARWCAIYGYRYIDEAIVIEESEAEIIRRIFEMYRHGISANNIVNDLNQKRILSPRGKQWSVATVHSILQNEKYKGDMLLQKYVSVDHITHKCIKNDGTAPSYYVKNSHKPIIDSTTFDQVQRIMELKAPRTGSSRYPYEDTPVICPFCGRKMTARIMHVQKEKKAVCCFGQDGCHRFSVKTWMLDSVILTAFSQMSKTVINCYDDSDYRILKIKEDGIPESVEYWFLAEAVRNITFSEIKKKNQSWRKKKRVIRDWTVHIEWVNGSVSSLPLPVDLRYTEEPVHVAELYEHYLMKLNTFSDSQGSRTKETQKKTEDDPTGYGSIE